MNILASTLMKMADGVANSTNGESLEDSRYGWNAESPGRIGMSKRSYDVQSRVRRIRRDKGPHKRYLEQRGSRWHREQREYDRTMRGPVLTLRHGLVMQNDPRHPAMRDASRNSENAVAVWRAKHGRKYPE